jgi:ABC-type proline/glycine betaine transport system ATPase subunit
MPRAVSAQGSGASVQALFRDVVRAHRIACIFVAHDLKEAPSVGDAFARLSARKLAQYATRDELLADPDSGAAEEIRFRTSMGARLEP